MNRLVRSTLALGFPLACACAAAAPSAMDGQEEVLVLEVAPERIPCTGEMEDLCLQVRRPDEEGWRTFYDTVEGFRHEEGVRYTIEVGRREIPDPAADASAWRYRLIRVLDREPGSAGGRP